MTLSRSSSGFRNEAQHRPVVILANGTYEIDLSDEHAGELRTVLQHYADAGRRMGGTRRSTSARPKAQPTATPSAPAPDEIRTWAQDQGLQVSTRGRISTKVREAYDAAQ